MELLLSDLLVLKSIQTSIHIDTFFFFSEVKFEKLLQISL